MHHSSTHLNKLFQLFRGAPLRAPGDSSNLFVVHQLCDKEKSSQWQPLSLEFRAVLIPAVVSPARGPEGACWRTSNKGWTHAIWTFANKRPTLKPEGVVRGREVCVLLDATTPRHGSRHERGVRLNAALHPACGDDDGQIQKDVRGLNSYQSERLSESKRSGGIAAGEARMSIPSLRGNPEGC